MAETKSKIYKTRLHLFLKATYIAIFTVTVNYFMYVYTVK